LALYFNNGNEDEILINEKQPYGFTPTDLAHLLGIHREWNVKASQKGLEIIAKKLDYSINEMIQELKDIFLGTIQQALATSGKLEKAIPVIAIGAPSHAWMPMMAKKYEMKVIVPEHAEVANAIGAAVGHIEEKVEVLIRKNQAHGYFIGFLGIRREEFLSLEKAKDVCINEARKIAKERVEAANVSNYKLLEDVEDVYCDTYEGDKKVYFETKISIVAVGIPDCICDSI